MVKNLKKIWDGIFDSSNLAFWDTERNAKKTVALCKASFLKKQEKLPKNC